MLVGGRPELDETPRQRRSAPGSVRKPGPARRSSNASAHPGRASSSLSHSLGKSTRMRSHAEDTQQGVKGAGRPRAFVFESFACGRCARGATRRTRTSTGGAKNARINVGACTRCHRIEHELFRPAHRENGCRPRRWQVAMDRTGRGCDRNGRTSRASAHEENDDFAGKRRKPTSKECGRGGWRKLTAPVDASFLIGGAGAGVLGFSAAIMLPWLLAFGRSRRARQRLARLGRPSEG